MSELPQLPFRADHVGSFLRPKYLLEARDQFAAGKIDAAQLREVEDKAIAEVVKMQHECGMKAITDGEFRRTYFHLDFLRHLGGVKVGEPSEETLLDGSTRLKPPMIEVDGKVRHVKPIQLDDFNYLNQQTAALGDAVATSKVAIPSPTMLHFRAGRAGIDSTAYPTLEPEFYEDVAAAFVDELNVLAKAGCRYVQLDDTNLAYLCDEKMREAARQRGDDPDELPHRYAQFINRVADNKPEGMTLSMHLCRGNFRSTFAAQGNYEPVAEALLSEMNIDAYFMEYDDDRSGDFRPLRFLPKDKFVVLGLISSKFGELESKDDIKRRIDEAAKYAPLEQLCLSPQCGFSSTVHGNNVTMDDQRRKLNLTAEIAREVWGDA